MKNFDVAIIGASTAGCAAAILYSQKGLRVALIERKNEINSHYKIMCTHTIQSSAIPLVKKLGVLSTIKEKGGVFTHHQIWSEHGWIKRHLVEQSFESFGLNITRKSFDTILLLKTLSSPNVTYFSGYGIQDLLYENGLICGINIYNKYKDFTIKLFSKLVIGADGTNSKVAKLANIGAMIHPNNRTGYFAYFKHTQFNNITHSKLWYLQPDIAYAFPNENGLMLLGYVAEQSNLHRVKQNLNENFIKLFEKLPDSSICKNVDQVSKFHCTGKMKNIFRKQPPAGLALIGDALLTLDPVAGLGIGYALQSAELLVDITEKSLKENSNFHTAAFNYYNYFFSIMIENYKLICKDSLGYPFGKTAKFIYSEAAKNPFIANIFLDLCARKIEPKTFFKFLEIFKNPDSPKTHSKEEINYLFGKIA